MLANKVTHGLANNVQHRLANNLTCRLADKVTHGLTNEVLVFSFKSITRIHVYIGVVDKLSKLLALWFC